jgi:hypothetical protein
VVVKAREIDELVRLTGDTVLRVDLPPLPAPPAGRGFSFEGGPAVYLFDASEGGPWAIHDAVPLEGGRTLVALGEAGARLLSPDGRCVAHFDVPAFSLVLSLHEDRALALAPRGGVKRISRLDLTRRRAGPWCDASLDAFSPEYDGSLWFVAVEDTVMAVDALAPELRALWRVPKVGGRVLEVAAGAAELSFVTASPEAEYERWTYALPDPTLRSRQPLPGGKVEQVLHLSLRPDGEVVALAPDGARWLGPYTGRQVPRPPTTPREMAGVVLGGTWLAELEDTALGPGVMLFERTQAKVRARLLFQGEHPVSARFVNGELLLFDTAGRLVRVDPARGEVRRVVVR